MRVSRRLGSHKIYCHLNNALALQLDHNNRRVQPSLPLQLGRLHGRLYSFSFSPFFSLQLTSLSAIQFHLCYCRRILHFGSLVRNTARVDASRPTACLFASFPLQSVVYGIRAFFEVCSQWSPTLNFHFSEQQFLVSDQRFPETSCPCLSLFLIRQLDLHCSCGIRDSNDRKE